MPFPEIQFGTDGWRAKLGEGFTTDRFLAVLNALIQTRALKRAAKNKQSVLIAYDARFQADAFARLAANHLQQAGLNAVLSDAAAGTPGIGASIVRRKAALGIMITASHNPPDYLGVKIKGPYGGSATPELIDELVQNLGDQKRTNPQQLVRFPDHTSDGVEIADINHEHLERLAAFFPVSKARDTIVHDGMYGSGRGLLAKAIDGSGAKVVAVRQSINPGFGGVGPEPVKERLSPMFRTVRRVGARLGIATDGDADRVAACDANGQFIFPHEIFALMITYLVDTLGQKGSVVRNFATGELVRKVAEDRGLSVETTPVGFKHIVERMLKGGVLIGGEESGGIAIPDYLPERDGIMCGMVLREMIIKNRKPIRRQLDALYKQYGLSTYRRWDLHIPEASKDAILNALKKNAPDKLSGIPVKEIDTLDGFKFLLNNGGWLLVRASGTEPILRVYVESESLSSVQKCYKSFAAWTQQVS